MNNFAATNYYRLTSLVSAKLAIRYAQWYATGCVSCFCFSARPIQPY